MMKNGAIWQKARVYNIMEIFKIITVKNVSTMHFIL